MRLPTGWPQHMVANVSDWVAPLARRVPQVYRRSRRLLEDRHPEIIRAAYRERIGRLAVRLPAYQAIGSTRIEDFPLLTKEEVRARPQLFSRRNLLPISRQHTSGSSGTALGVARSLGAVVFEQATLDWLVGHAGVDLRRARTAILRGLDIKCPSDSTGPFWRRSGKSLIVSSNHISRDTVAEIVEALHSFAPDVVLAYPSTLENLVHLMQQEQIKWRCPLVVTSSEVLTPHARRLIADTLACDVFDYYGQAERVACAYSIEENRYWFLPTYSQVELLATPENGRFEIAGTPFHNTAQILVRYRTGDHAHLPASAAPEIADVAAGRRPFSGIAGRSDDVLLGSGGRVLVGIDHIPRGLEQLGRFQFIQDAADHVRILVQSPVPASDDWSSRVLDRARLKIPTDIAIDIEFVDELVTSIAGKTPFVIRDHSLLRPGKASSLAEHRAP